MQQELNELGLWLAEHPEAVRRLKPVRSSVVLKPGVYYNRGTGMVERIYAPQHVALGNRIFRLSGDPGAPVEELWRKVMGG
ncbi:hypothetical protein E0L93_03390 [Rubrobacter taiwanensis]|jgi:hypothetical protein|uniref:Uncharacterized protein n=1 Tax=Rubrobacter taiwanensis TaxID=185139 RepID=A0A4R1BQI5_9ACTN|nr:hypothetical protein [Rubrobacter taiwanensis]TCJ20003.1 hypothetical protein E0L93_03390 [Rubrobacter taiwanensis]